MFKQQGRSKNLFSLLVFVFLATPTISSAQSRCPGRDCLFPLRAQGLNDALQAVGERAGNVRLQTAVWEQGPRPVMIRDDAGRVSCAWNCDQQGETGQVRRWDIKVNGADERILPEATRFTDAELSRFSGIGRIECPTSRGTTSIGTAFHVGSFSTMATAAHAFVDPVTKAKIAPTTCAVTFYNLDGGRRESIGISYVKSRWDEPGKFGDISNDIAIIKLNGESKTPREFSEAVAGERLANLSRVSVIGFNLDIPGETVFKRVYGQAIRPASTTQLVTAAANTGLPLNNPENIALTSYDSNHGTSGAPVFNASGEIIGVHQGSFGGGGAEFNQTNSYNRAVIFDQRFITDLNAVIARSSTI